MTYHLGVARAAMLIAATLCGGAAFAQGLAPSPAPTRAAILAATRQIIESARYATFITIGENGHPQARIVDPAAPNTDLVIWVATNASTRKVAQISANNRVTLLYFDQQRSSYVTLLATAQIVRDPAEKTKRWKPEWAPFYKGGATGDDYLLIRVVPTRIEIVSTALGMISDPATWKPVTLELR